LLKIVADRNRRDLTRLMAAKRLKELKEVDTSRLEKILEDEMDPAIAETIAEMLRQAR
jgi:hypothetical protein